MPCTIEKVGLSFFEEQHPVPRSFPLLDHYQHFYYNAHIKSGVFTMAQGDNTYSDVQLAEAFRNGDAHALKVLWDNFYKSLVYFADQLVKNDLLSEDIVSETFVKVWNLRDRFENVHNIKAFLYVTVRNSCYDHLRSQQIHTRIHKEILYTSDLSSEMQRDDYDMMYAEYLQLLYAQVNELPERCREVFRLYFFEQRTTREIADLLNITEQTVRNQKTKAVHLLRALLLKRSAPAYVLLALLFVLDE